MDLAREAGLAVGWIPDVHLEHRGGGLHDTGDLWGRFESLTRHMRSKGADRSIEAFLSARHDLSRADRQLLVSMVEGYEAAPLPRASEKAISTAGEKPSTPEEREQLRVLSGYDGVVDALARRVQLHGGHVRLRTEVRALRWRPGRVAVETASGRRYEAARAIVTLPVGVLQAAPGKRGAVRLEPFPEATRRALAGIAMGHVVRIVFRFRESFWRERLDGRDAAFFHGRGPFRTLWSAAPLDVPMLTAWAGGPAASRLLASGPENGAARSAVVDREVLRRVAGPRARPRRRRAPARLESRSVFARSVQLFARGWIGAPGAPRQARREDALLRGRGYRAGGKRDRRRRHRERPSRGAPSPPLSRERAAS